MYRDEQGILREPDGAIAWGFIGQYREKNPALYEEFIYPTYEHGERVEYWGGKVAAWADENRMDIEDAAKVIAFVPEELRKETMENAYFHVAVKAAQDGGDLPDMGAVFPLAVAGSIKHTGKAPGKVKQTSEPNGSKSGLVQGAEGTSKNQLKFVTEVGVESARKLGTLGTSIWFVIKVLCRVIIR
ncbi:hypothetical protein KDJ56_20680 [Brevibacillus composti]|uniref:Uncharacterized protein n=1 Tax=Brevibacillus composti TaxID=2796470 RepID=A0A7T5EKJ8_9BACL|nr:hypothetical protein [Brevibacillus composti]QQE74226.1 hypothetical protein JD108_20745 [Brevibacillus composti]QUO41308.1 hypothetical protein KDJ56_20680 [Brevibacillus composti]